MAYTVLPIAGVELNTITPESFEYTNGTTLIGIPSFGPLGSQTFGSDGKRYVFAKAGGVIAAGATAVSIDASTFAATSGGGSYVAPAESMVSGDFGWFAATSV